MMFEGRAVKAGLKTLDWATSAVLVVVLFAVVAVVLAPHLFGWRYGVLRSGSMSPAMPAGAAIVVAPVGIEDVRPGDVVTFRSVVNRDLLVTHRVVEVTEYDDRPALRTQGDGNEEPDAAIVTPNRLMGRVVFSVPFVGIVAQYLRTTEAFIFLLVIPTALIVAIELRELAAGVSELSKSRKTVPPRKNGSRKPLFFLTLVPLGIIAIKARSFMKSKAKARDGVGSAA
jgi:signal peptidase I